MTLAKKYLFLGGTFSALDRLTYREGEIIPKFTAMGAGSMEIIYQQMYQRSEILIRKQVEIAEQIKRLEAEEKGLAAELEAAIKYLQTRISDGSVRAAIQKLKQLKKDLTTNKRARTVEAKAHIVIRILQEHGEDGLDNDEILALVPSYKVELTRKYLTAILIKLRKNGMLVKTGRKFFVTDPGTTPRTINVSAGELRDKEATHA
jgi:hypothetical protein